MRPTATNHCFAILLVLLAAGFGPAAWVQADDDLDREAREIRQEQIRWDNDLIRLKEARASIDEMKHAVVERSKDWKRRQDENTAFGRRVVSARPYPNQRADYNRYSAQYDALIAERQKLKRLFDLIDAAEAKLKEEVLALQQRWLSISRRIDALEQRRKERGQESIQENS